MFPKENKKGSWLIYLIVIVVVVLLFFWIKSFTKPAPTQSSGGESVNTETRYVRVSNLTNLPEDDDFYVGNQGGLSYTSVLPSGQGTPTTSSNNSLGPTTCRDFTYSEWGSCVNGIQSRAIRSVGPAGCTGGAPILSQNCGLVVGTANICTNFIYSNWGSCNNGIQTRTIQGSIPTGCSGGTPILSQNCTQTNTNTNQNPPTCTSFTYNAWSTCSNGVQSRTIATRSPSNCTGGNPVLSQSCSSPSTPCTYTYTDWGTCTNGMQSRTITSSLPTGCSGGIPQTSRACLAATTTIPFYKEIEYFQVTQENKIDLEKNVDITSLKFDWGDDFGACAGTVKLSEDMTNWNTLIDNADVTTPSNHSLNNPGRGRHLQFSKFVGEGFSCSHYYVQKLSITGSYDAPITSSTTTATTTNN